MSFRQLPRRHNNFIRPPPTPPPRSLRYKYTFAAHPDTIDDILSTCLNWVLPMLFFFVIIVLVTMLTSYTLVMRRPLPRVFTFVIVITFSVLITITFFILVAFHMYRCQRVRSMLSEAFPEDSYHDPYQSSGVLPRAAQGSRATVHPSIPWKRMKSQAKIRQARQSQDLKMAAPVALKATDSFNSSTAAPSSRKPSLVVGENEQSRSSTPQQQLPMLIITPSPSFDGRPHAFVQPFVPDVPEPPPKDDLVYHLPPGPPCTTLPSAGFRPPWADDIEQRIAANQSASTPERRWQLWSKVQYNSEFQ